MQHDHKLYSTLCAKAALHGIVVTRSAADDGSDLYTAKWWTSTFVATGLDELAAWLAEQGVPA